MDKVVINGVEVSATGPSTPIPASLERRRDFAVLSRTDFCLAAHREGLLNQEDAVIAATGGFPTVFEAALGLLDPEVAFEIRVSWAATSEIRRTSQNLIDLAAASGITDAQLDAVYGL